MDAAFDQLPPTLQQPPASQPLDVMMMDAAVDQQPTTLQQPHALQQPPTLQQPPAQYSLGDDESGSDDERALLEDLQNRAGLRIPETPPSST